MALTVLKPGIQSTIQAAPRRGTRHLGVPASGPADTLSMALANRLVGNASVTAALEVPFGMVALEADKVHAIALTGAHVSAEINGKPVPMHQTLFMRAGETLSIGGAEIGARVYLAVAGGFAADEFLGSGSTCLPAGFGGLAGRSIRAGDVLEAMEYCHTQDVLQTPHSMQQIFTNAYALRCVPGPDEIRISGWEYGQDFVATRRADRTGIEVTGGWPRLEQAGLRPSAPVFTGAVQLTPSGSAFVLLPDAQTTGGYPHVLQVARVDRHLLGQIRPGDRVRFLRRTPDEAADDLRSKIEFFREWVPDFSL